MKFNNLVVTFVSSAIAFYSQSSFGTSSSSLEQQKNRTVSPRIINGVEAKKDDYPFIVGLINSSTVQGGKISPFCGASFIGSHYILTASHCVEGAIAADIDVVVGDHNLKDSNSGVRYKVAQIYMHEDYDSVATNNDIAILELETAITNVLPIKPMTPELEASLKVGDLLTVMGWGNMSVTDDPSYPTVLQEVEVALYDRAKCDSAYKAEGGITDVMLCAGFEAGGKDSCQGDSGGPLVIKKNNEWYQVGVVSFGDGCAVAGIPGVYARVSKFVDWVKQKKAGVSYQQNVTPGYVENGFVDTASFTFKNLTATEYGITKIEFSGLNNVAQPTVESNSCNSATIKQHESCEFTVKVTSTGLGEGGFDLKIHTNHPENNLAIQYYSVNALEKSSLDIKNLVDMTNDNIEWYSGGDAVWEAQTTKILEGNNAIASGDINDSQVSVLLAVIKNPEVKNLSFNYLVEAEDGYDGLRMTVNGQKADFFATGIIQTVFKEEKVKLQDGIDRITFIFAKDQTDEDAVGLNKAYIDLVKAESVNIAPVAKLSKINYQVKVKSESTLDASQSVDANGDVISYKWEFVGDSFGATLKNTNANKATFIAADKAGKVTFKVTTTDPKGASSSVIGTVTITKDTVAVVVIENKKSAGAGGFIFIISLLLLSLIRRKS